MKREELETYYKTSCVKDTEVFYSKEDANKVMDAMERDYEANRKLWEAEIASLKERVNELVDIVEKNRVRRITDKERIKELEDKVQMHDFFWEGCSLSKRGFKNTIDVANYIKELEAQQPKWISVDDRLPKRQGYYIVFDSEDPRFDAKDADGFPVHAGVNLGHYDGEEYLFGIGTLCNPPITHWMECRDVPPPKSEEK